MASLSSPSRPATRSGAARRAAGDAQHTSVAAEAPPAADHDDLFGSSESGSDDDDDDRGSSASAALGTAAASATPAPRPAGIALPRGRGSNRTSATSTPSQHLSPAPTNGRTSPCEPAVGHAASGAVRGHTQNVRAAPAALPPLPSQNRPERRPLGPFSPSLPTGTALSSGPSRSRSGTPRASRQDGDAHASSSRRPVSPRGSATPDKASWPAPSAEEGGKPLPPARFAPADHAGALEKEIRTSARLNKRGGLAATGAVTDIVSRAKRQRIAGQEARSRRESAPASDAGSSPPAAHREEATAPAARRANEAPSAAVSAPGPSLSLDASSTSALSGDQMLQLLLAQMEDSQANGGSPHSTGVGSPSAPPALRSGADLMLGSPAAHPPGTPRATIFRAPPDPLQSAGSRSRRLVKPALPSNLQDGISGKTAIATNRRQGASSRSPDAEVSIPRSLLESLIAANSAGNLPAAAQAALQRALAASASSEASSPAASTRRSRTSRARVERSQSALSTAASTSVSGSASPLPDASDALEPSAAGAPAFPVDPRPESVEALLARQLADATTVHARLVSNLYRLKVDAYVLASARQVVNERIATQHDIAYRRSFVNQRGPGSVSGAPIAEPPPLPMPPRPRPPRPEALDAPTGDVEQAQTVFDRVLSGAYDVDSILHDGLGL